MLLLILTETNEITVQYYTSNTDNYGQNKVNDNQQ